MNGRLFMKDLAALLHGTGPYSGTCPFDVGVEGGIPADGDPLKHMILVDNSLMSFGMQPRNGVPIDGWICDPFDEGLLDCLALLDGLRYVDDVRSVLGLRIGV
jgi:TFIIF-interacting CTD phosphatase-like protein